MTRRYQRRRDRFRTNLTKRRDYKGSFAEYIKLLVFESLFYRQTTTTKNSR